MRIFRCKEHLFGFVVLKLSIVGILIISVFADANNNVPYISPGIRIGWAPGHAITLGLKTSIGVLNEGSIYNITLGGKIALYRFDRTHYFSHLSCDLQYGHWVPDSLASSILVGGGAGIALGQKSPGQGQIAIWPHAAIFGGNVLFGTADFLLVPQFGVYSDFGLQGVLPFPLVNFDFRGK